MVLPYSTHKRVRLVSRLNMGAFGENLTHLIEPSILTLEALLLGKCLRGLTNMPEGNRC